MWCQCVFYASTAFWLCIKSMHTTARITFLWPCCSAYQLILATAVLQSRTKITNVIYFSVELWYKMQHNIFFDLLSSKNYSNALCLYWVPFPTMDTYIGRYCTLAQNKKQYECMWQGHRQWFLSCGPWPLWSVAPTQGVHNSL